MTVFRKLVTVTNVDVTFMLWLVYCLACCPIVLCLVFLAVFDGVRGPIGGAWVLDAPVRLLDCGPYFSWLMRGLA